MNIESDVQLNMLHFLLEKRGENCHRKLEFISIFDLAIPSLFLFQWPRNKVTFVLRAFLSLPPPPQEIISEFDENISKQNFLAEVRKGYKKQKQNKIFEKFRNLSKYHYIRS